MWGKSLFNRVSPTSKGVVKMGDLSFQHSLIADDLEKNLKDIFRDGSYIGGKFVSDFESQFADYLKVGNCVGVGNGTDALEIILLGLDLPPGSAVIVPANSFVATAEAVVNVGLVPIIIDIDDDFSLDEEKLAASMGPSVSAVIVVHLYGYPQDVELIKKIIAGRDIKIIEDCAQAHGARRGGSFVGTLGDAAAFSFYPGKNLGALGDAGAVVTNNSELALRFRRIANHGRLSKFDHDVIGRNSRLDSIQAAALSSKLKHLDSWNEKRRLNATVYRQELHSLVEVVLPPQSQGFEVYHHFVIRILRRDALRGYLNSRGIQTGIHYPESIDAMKPFENYASQPASRSRLFSDQMLSLPVAEHLSRLQIMNVARAIKEFYSD
jgi:dTDP-4-amino-4,6-dideoxygalactose transaminase